MNRVAVMLLYVLLGAAFLAAEAVYAFRGSTGRSAPSHSPAMRSAPAVRHSTPSHHTPSVKSQNFNKTNKTNLSQTKTNKTNLSQTKTNKSNLSQTKTNKTNLSQTKTNKTNLSQTKTNKTLTKQVASNQGLKQVGTANGRNVYSGKGPHGPNGKNFAPKGLAPRLGPGGRPWNNRFARWGWIGGRWWPWFAFIGGGWWWWNQGSWMTVEDGPEALYVETEPTVVTQQRTVTAQPVCCVDGECKITDEESCDQQGGFMAKGCSACGVSQQAVSVEPPEVVTPVAEVCEIPICCVNRECKITRNEESCTQQGGFMATSCSTCTE